MGRATESGITRERVEGGEWGWKEERKCFKENIGSAKSNSGQGSGTLTEGAFRAVFEVFSLRGMI